MKCFNHPDRDAVAICSVCGQGLCESCSVKIAGKFYCKPDADRVFGEEKQMMAEEFVRPTSIIVAAILFYILGALGIIWSVGIMASGSVASLLIGAQLVSPLIIGLIGLVLSMLYLIAGYWLWNGLREGGILGVVLSVISVSFSIPLLAAPFLAAVTAVLMVVGVVLIMLIAMSWNYLT